MKKCVFVIGPEASGSKLVAKICSHVLGIHEFGDWHGTAWSDKGFHKVCHRSLPYGFPPNYPNIEQWVSKYGKDHEIFFVLTTRDISISELSRFYKWSKPLEKSQQQSARAKEIMSTIINRNYRYFIWSYETFMFLQKDYLNELYEFLEVESEFIPPLKDGNKSKIVVPEAR